MEATNINFLQSTFHREENGGYETWEFNIGENFYELFCDIRLPGIVSSFYEDLPEDKSKVIVVDICYKTKINNAIEIYDPSQSSYELQEVIANTTAKILLEKIKPKRDFKYVAFAYLVNNNSFYENLISKICNNTSADVIRKVYRILSKDMQLLIESGQWKYLVGELK